MPQPWPPSPGRRRYLNDHTLIRANGRWHLFSIVGDSAALGEAPDSAAIGLATSTDLFSWTRLPSGPLFRGHVARDPMVVRIGDEWVMYYTELSASDDRHLVCYRRSGDLLHWSEPGIAYTDASTGATGVSVTESPFVVERDGWYYLFIGPRGGYEGTDVLASRDPFRFALDGYAGHVPGHAVEPVADGDQWYASAAGWFRDGLYLAPLHWRATPPSWRSPDNPVAAVDVQGRLTVFALDAGDRSMLRRVQFDPEAGTWSEWEEFGGPAGAAPAVARAADRRLEVFAPSPDGSVVSRRRQRSPGSLTWDPWEAGFGGPTGAPPVVAVNADGRLEVFALVRG
ncbi:glycosyl hydrolase family 32, partial [Streptomyces fimicarius]